MRLQRLWSWMAGSEARQATNRPRKTRFTPRLTTLEDLTLPNGYIAAGAGAGAPPLVAIRVDIRDALQIDPFGTFYAFNPGFRGGVRVTTGNFDGDYQTPDSLVVGAGPGGGPHIIIYNMQQDPATGLITVAGIRDQFMAYDPRFTGGVHLTTGDLDGDGRAELIVTPDVGGGPNVRIFKVGPTGKFYLALQFMAFDPGFRGGVTAASGQGYNTPVEVRQVLNAQLPAGPSGIPASNFSVVPYVNSPRPGLNTADPFFDFPLVGGMNLFDPADPSNPFPGPSNTIQTQNPLTFFPYVTVGSGTLQYLSGNLLNNYGNVAYEPNEVDLVPPIHQVPPEQPLVFASWSAMSMHPPDFNFVPSRVYGPFVQIAPAQNNNPPILTRLKPSSGQVNFRNQLVLGAGPGGGPHVKVFDFVADAQGFLHINNQIGFMAMDPTFRGGVDVAIGSFVDLPTPTFDPTTDKEVVRPDTTSAQITALTFPYTRETYRQFTAQILVTPASGGGQAVVWSDFNPDVFDPTTGSFAPARRTSIMQLDLRPTLLDTTTTLNPLDPLNGFMDSQDVTTFSNAIDPQFRGQVLSTWSALKFAGSAQGVDFLGQRDNVARAQMVFAAGANPGNGASRGSHVRIFDKLGPNPFGLPVAPNGNSSHDPVDDFFAFTQGMFPNGLSGISFGFGTLPTPTRDVVELSPITVNTVTDPILV
jgi:hypothetical protein